MKITELFKQGEFVVSAEVGPPKGFISNTCWRMRKPI